MTKIAFWNVQRLGAGTDAGRKAVLTSLAANWKKPDAHSYCELLTSCDWPPPQNMTYRKENDHQLCYGALKQNGASFLLGKVTPEATDGYRDAGYKGGNDFTQLADRALAKVGKIGGAQVYVIHAPASNNAVKVMSFIAASLNATHGTDAWLVVGDFNVEPEVLAEQNPGIEINDLIRASGSNTHYSKANNSWKELDYALANFPVKVWAANPSGWYPHSDHSPILLQF